MSIKQTILRISIIILVVETLIMIMLDSIEYELSSLMETAIDSFLLVCMSTPFIYWWVIKPHNTEREKEKDYLLHKSRMAQMGEMLSMIAHQWRQPLAAISASAINAKMMIELEQFDLEKEKERAEFNNSMLRSLSKINEFVQSLSQTINDFRDFYKTDKRATVALFDQPVTKALNIVRDSFERDGIEIIENYESEDMLSMHEGEMMQVILNILENAQDNFKERETVNPIVSISTVHEGDKTTLTVCDNGGGIPDDVMPKVFDPYFSTKNQKNGSGLGLYMSKMIIEKHHKGELNVTNKDKGACFTIELHEEKKSS